MAYALALSFWRVATFRPPARIAEIKDTIGLPVEPVEPVGPVKKGIKSTFFRTTGLTGQRAQLANSLCSIEIVYRLLPSKIRKYKLK